MSVPQDVPNASHRRTGMGYRGVVRLVVQAEPPLTPVACYDGSRFARKAVAQMSVLHPPYPGPLGISCRVSEHRDGCFAGIGIKQRDELACRHPPANLTRMTGVVE